MGLFDKIKDVVQDVAPVVLPFAINAIAPGLGTIASGALGAGIGTLIQGGDIEDALKAGAVGGATGALYKGIGSMAGGGKFMEGISSDLGQTKTFFSDPLSPANYGQMVGGSYTPETVPAADTSNMGPRVEAPQAPLEGTLRAEFSGQPNTVQQVQDATQLTEPSILGGPFQKGYTETQLMSSPEFEAMTSKGMSADKALTRLEQKYNPSFMDKYGLVGAAGIGALALTEEDPEEEDFVYESVYDPAIHKVNISTGRIPTMQDVVVPYAQYMETGGVASVPDKFKGFSKLPEGIQQKMDPELAKKYEDGGDVQYFPRRNGGIGPGEGTGTKDDVPAMLMDGEFVMTRNAVKAAGGGNIKKGINNMYGLMRNLEARA